MPRPSSIENHPERAAIEAALLEGKLTYREISGRFGVSKSALDRHREKLAPTIAKAQGAAEAAHADTLLEQVQNLQGKALGILEKAEAAGDLRTSLAAIREARGNLELLARLLGELQESTTVNVLVSPVWVEVRSVVIKALEPFPDARLAVARALEALNAGR